MNIRKADSKGRLTGFVPDTYYWVSRNGDLFVALEADEPDANDVFLRGPSEAAREHLEAWRERGRVN